MFYGHRHTDGFEIFYDEATKKRALQVAYVAPSLTAYPNLNPGYRIYTVDGLYTNSSFVSKIWYISTEFMAFLNDGIEGLGL